MSGYLPAVGGGRVQGEGAGGGCRERVQGDAALWTGMLGICHGQWRPVSRLPLLLPEM